MKNTFLITATLLLLVGNFSSCTETVEKIDAETKQTAAPEIESADMNGFKSGTWRIDSVAENQQIIDRLVGDSVIQVFNFRKEGVFSVMEVMEHSSSDRVLGKWKVHNDEISIIYETGGKTMTYNFEIDEARLTLHGNFEISTQNKKKPTFYLSKYSEKRNNAIYGPVKK